MVTGLFRRDLPARVLAAMVTVPRNRRVNGMTRGWQRAIIGRFALFRMDGRSVYAPFIAIVKLLFKFDRS